MIHRMQLGIIPDKPHTALYLDGKLILEQCLTRQGFDGPFSMLYYRNQPMAESKVTEHAIPDFTPFGVDRTQSLARRHLPTFNTPRGGDFLTARKTMLVCDDLHVSISKPDHSVSKPESRFFMNGDGDELYFINSGRGYLESAFGAQPFKKHDYILIPKNTAYRIHFDKPRRPEDEPTALIFEGRPWLGIPGDYRNSYGQIDMYAPYSHRDFGLPEQLLTYDPELHGEAPFEVIVKRRDQLTIHEYPEFPLDIVGWDGVLYPITFNIHDFQPKTGLIHLPPTVHTTFAGNGFVVCSFVPRKVDYHPKAIPCPYAHASSDMDEILYYVEGNFTSRKGIKPESISLHPAGITHGPHPGTYEASIGTDRSDELAVMCDTYKALLLTDFARKIEDKDYHLTWNEQHA